MSSLTVEERACLDELLDMSGGYVLDFHNRSFQIFIADSIGKDIESGSYDRYGTSKAKRLRALWDIESDEEVGKLLSDLLNYYKDIKGSDNEPLYQQCASITDRLLKAVNKKVSASPSQSNKVHRFSSIESSPFERLFQMDTGYVLDFTNDTFRNFVNSSVGIDLYDEDKYASGSKASRLRTLWKKESNAVIGKILFDLLMYWKNTKLEKNIDISKQEDYLFDRCMKIVSGLLSNQQINSFNEKAESEKLMAEGITISQFGEDFHEKSLASLNEKERKEPSLVFVSYSRKDKSWVDMLRKILAPATKRGDIKLWIDEHSLQPGNRWKEGIENAISSAKVAVLMISPDFFDSDYVTDKELPAFVESEREGKITMLPIHVAPCLYKQTDVDKFQAANDPDNPLHALSDKALSSELVSIAEKY